jgi:phage terminase large subunit
MDKSQENPFFQHFAKYRENSKLWVRDSFFPNWENINPSFGTEEYRDANFPGWRDLPLYGPEPYQDEILDAYSANTRLMSIRSGHRVGKTTTLAWVIIHRIIFFFPQKTVATAATEDQLFDALASEVKAWIEKLPPDIQALLEVKSEIIALKSKPNDSFIRFRVSRADKPEALAGIHSRFTLLVGDEASGIPDPVFEGAMGSLADENPILILAGNPVRSQGLFYETHTKLRNRWTTFHINAEKSRRVNRDFIEDIRLRFGELSNVYRVRVLGEFPLADDDTILPFELVEPSLRRDVQPKRVQEIWGLDCARFGRDSSALARRRANVLVCPVESRYGKDTMQVVGWVKQEWDALGPTERPEWIIVDSIGIGAGVVDRLRELQLPVRGVNVSESPAMREKYKNLTTELWFKMKFWFEARDTNIANDEKLLTQLIARKFKILSTGKSVAETKDDMKRRGLESPNEADAFMLTFASEATLAQGQRAPSRSGNIKRKLQGIV